MLVEKTKFCWEFGTNMASWKEPLENNAVFLLFFYFWYVCLSLILLKKKKKRKHSVIVSRPMQAFYQLTYNKDLHRLAKQHSLKP